MENECGWPALCSHDLRHRSIEENTGRNRLNRTRIVDLISLIRSNPALGTLVSITKIHHDPYAHQPEQHHQ